MAAVEQRVLAGLRARQDFLSQVRRSGARHRAAAWVAVRADVRSTWTKRRAPSARLLALLSRPHPPNRPPAQQPTPTSPPPPQELRYYAAQLAALQPGAPAPTAPPSLPAFSLELPPETRELDGGARGSAAADGDAQLCEACREHLEVVQNAEQQCRDQQEYLASLPPPKAQPAAAAPVALAGGEPGGAAASAGGLRRRQG